MANDFVGQMQMNMPMVRGEIKPWTDKDGNNRYYINNIEWAIDDYRSFRGFSSHSYYDWGEMRASPGRVREIIEGNVLAKTKAYIDEDGFVHVYGYAVAGIGEEMGIPNLIERAINFKYGFCTEGERIARLQRLVSDDGTDGRMAKPGDVVEIMDGRKEVGKMFKVAFVKYYTYSRWASPSVTLYADDGFKVSADHCEIRDLGYSY